MKPEQATALRAPFPPSVIGKLPRTTCRACSNSDRGTCERHPQKRECRECGNWMTTAHLHLDYVGHAAATDRLLQVDPAWSWEPLAFDSNGLPALDAYGGLWIRLTIAEVTRLGYGDAKGKKGPDAVKEAIGDAIRNAAMRFGVALDLWAKADLHAETPERPERPTPISSAPAPTAPAEILPAEVDAQEFVRASRSQLNRLFATFAAFADWGDRDDRLNACSHIIGRKITSSSDLTAQEATRLIRVLEKLAADADPSAALEWFIANPSSQHTSEDPKPELAEVPA